jgi:aspartyl-tRNA(Asn)/glutamyl-tRNA(Gln) amidotransferase subunit C
MPVSLGDVERVAALARLALSDEEKRTMMAQLNEVLRYMEELNGVDTSAVEPLSHVIDLPSVFREDELRPGLTREEALRNAPARDDKFFKVPKVIGDR